MKSIKFINFNIIEGRIECDVLRFEDDNLTNEDKVFFELSEKIIVNKNLIAIALSTLCGTIFDNVYMDLEIGDEVYNNLKSFFDCEFNVKEINQSGISKGKGNIILNFSGGFDSLAIYLLMPHKFKLVSLDFSGKFAREEKFFKVFSPYTVKTNIRLLGLSRNHWSFMGIGAILFKEYLEADYETFGSILEAGPYTFTKKHSLLDNPISFPMCFAGLNELHLARGITEPGTALIISNKSPYFINSSLNSLANIGEEKRYRKQLLIQIIANKYNKDLKLDLVDAGNKVDFNQSLAHGFLALYIAKFAGIDELNKVVLNVPDEFIELSNQLSLDFYEKFNPNFLNSIPKDLKGDYLKALSDAEVYPYNQKDWEEFNIVVSLLRKYYSNLDYLLNLE